ncbi:MAG: IS1 family transposase [Chloroflexi bacterium]|nr:IS1 family transposase [Chloroflexota bacterium]
MFPATTHLSVGKETGLTAHIERWNFTLRQSLARFVRKILSFSKSDTFHEVVLSVFRTWDCPCRTTPKRSSG